MDSPQLASKCIDKFHVMFKTGKFLSVLLIVTHATLVTGQTQYIRNPRKPLDITIDSVINPHSTSYLGKSLDAPHHQELPEIGDPTGTSFTPTQEKEFGEAFFRSLHGEVEISLCGGNIGILGRHAALLDFLVSFKAQDLGLLHLNLRFTFSDPGEEVPVIDRDQ